MNFVGHAHVAKHVRSEAPYVLGAMLPDFASMCRARLRPVSDVVIADGVALHHRTDDAFHAGPAFVALCSSTAHALEARGISWGGARAAAHVGIELLIDGFLLDDPATCDAYLEAIALLRDGDRTRSLEVEGPGAPRWPSLLARVHGHGLPNFYRDPEIVGERLIAILASRPRLTIDPGQRDALVDVMVATKAAVQQRLEELVAPARI